jgi:hypothetical protein
MVDDDAEGNVRGMEGGAKGAWAREGGRKDEGGYPKGARPKGARAREGGGKDGVEATPARELTPGTRGRRQLKVGNRFLCEA